MDIEALKNVWKNGVEADYQKGFLVTEASFQASLYFHLRRELGDGYTIFVEPKMKYDGAHPTRRPDLIVVGDDEITAIIELKFFPWWTPNRSNFSQDLVNLWDFRRSANEGKPEETEFCFFMDPKGGYDDKKKVRRLSRDTALVFGIICGDAKSCLENYKPDEGMWECPEDRDSLILLCGDISEEKQSFEVVPGI